MKFLFAVLFAAAFLICLSVGMALADTSAGSSDDALNAVQVIRSLLKKSSLPKCDGVMSQHSLKFCPLISQCPAEKPFCVLHQERIGRIISATTKKKTIRVRLSCVCSKSPVTIAPAPTPTATPTAKPTATPTVTPTANPTPKPTPVATATPIATPTSVPKENGSVNGTILVFQNLCDPLLIDGVIFRPACGSPYIGSFSITRTAQNSEEEVASGSTDASGHFEMSLPPGNYTLSVGGIIAKLRANPRSDFGGFSGTVGFKIESGKTTQVSLTLSAPYLLN